MTGVRGYSCRDACTVSPRMVVHWHQGAWQTVFAPGRADTGATDSTLGHCATRAGDHRRSVYWSNLERFSVWPMRWPDKMISLVRIDPISAHFSTCRLDRARAGLNRGNRIAQPYMPWFSTPGMIESIGTSLCVVERDRRTDKLSSIAATCWRVKCFV
jgi:hypothetical protein